MTQSIASVSQYTYRIMRYQSLQVRLNERNVVELINKLNELGFLGDGLLHTVNGREYVTPEHLRKEIVETVEQAGGRMSLVRNHTTCSTTVTCSIGNAIVSR